MPLKCCQSTPRCRDCPARRPADDELLVVLGMTAQPRLPEHLRGVPPSLHKYEPLLKRSFAERAGAR